MTAQLASASGLFWQAESRAPAKQPRPPRLPRLQGGDTEAAEAALQPAWAALDEGVHKQGRNGIAAFLRQFHAGEAAGVGRLCSRLWAVCDAPCALRLRAPTPCRLPVPLGWVYCGMATVGVSLLERQRRHQDAVDRLRQLLGAALPGLLLPGRAGDVACAACTRRALHAGRRDAAEGSAALPRACAGGRCCLSRRGEWWIRLATDLEKHLSK